MYSASRPGRLHPGENSVGHDAWWAPEASGNYADAPCLKPNPVPDRYRVSLPIELSRLVLNL
jgi:hypothetical protein